MTYRGFGVSPRIPLGSHDQGPLLFPMSQEGFPGLRARPYLSPTPSSPSFSPSTHTQSPLPQVIAQQCSWGTLPYLCWMPSGSKPSPQRLCPQHHHQESTEADTVPQAYLGREPGEEPAAHPLHHRLPTDRPLQGVRQGLNSSNLRWKNFQKIVNDCGAPAQQSPAAGAAVCTHRHRGQARLSCTKAKRNKKSSWQTCTQQTGMDCCVGPICQQVPPNGEVSSHQAQHTTQMVASLPCRLWPEPSHSSIVRAGMATAKPSLSLLLLLVRP